LSGHLTLEDANDVVRVLVATGRAVPAAEWVSWLKQADAIQHLDGLF
jgi:hypothetical protein